MSLQANDFEQFYNELVRDYPGKWVLISKIKVLFADSSIDLVYEEYFKRKSEIDCEILLVDTGEASFYAFTIFSC